jgi:hypothetical protein
MSRKITPSVRFRQELQEAVAGGGRDLKDLCEGEWGRAGGGEARRGLPHDKWTRG